MPRFYLERMMVLADRNWNSRTVHKEIRWGDNLTVSIRNGRVQIQVETYQRGQSLPFGRAMTEDDKCNESLFIGGHS
jgi:hypothetical protein